MLKRLKWLLVVLALAYVAWPLWSGWQLRQALRSRDLVGLEARVDWPTLRANLKPRLAQAVREDADRSPGVTGVLKRAIGTVLADRGVDYAVTPKTLSRVLAGREFIAARGRPDSGAPAPGAGETKAPAPVDAEAEDPDDPVPPKRLRWAFFETPTRFRIETTHPRLPDSRIVSIFALTGMTWKLVDIDLVSRGK